MVNRLLIVYPFLGRHRARNGGRQTFQKIVGRNHGPGIIFLHDRIHLIAREHCLDGQNENINILQVTIERWIRHRTIVAPDGDSQSPCLNDLNGVIEPDHIVWRTRLYV